jgi:hypothetical protein
MPVAKRLTIENVNLDDDREMDEFDEQVMAAGLERVRASFPPSLSFQQGPISWKPDGRQQQTAPPPLYSRLPTALEQ